MGRARQQLGNSVASVRWGRGRDSFVSTFGEGRGLSASERKLRERERAPKPFTVASADSSKTHYFLHNDPYGADSAP